MNKYRVVLTTMSSINIDHNGKIVEDYSFPTEHSHLKLRRIRTEEDIKITGEKFGWLIEVDIEEVDIDHAIAGAHQISELFITMLCLTSGVEAYPSKIILSYDITEGTIEREFVQYFYDLPITRPQTVDIQIFANTLENVVGINSDKKARLARSIGWLRKGINEKDSLDQFLNLWQGLETLNPLLAKHFNCENSGKEIVEQTCVKTGNTFYLERTTKQGLEHLVEETGITRTEWKKLTNIRNGISHGYKKMDTLLAETLHYSPKIAVLLYKGICLIVDLPVDNAVVKHLNNVAPVKVGEHYASRHLLIEEDVNKLAISPAKYPYFISRVKITPLNNGNGFEVEQNLKPVIGCKKYGSYEMDVAGREVKLELVSVE
ncbi:HEPN domain-containing protein [Paenibacillus sp. OVF10]|nr:HEPN domain-containing protein [Paenibacillus sp. OVF10]